MALDDNSLTHVDMYSNIVTNKRPYKAPTNMHGTKNPIGIAAPYVQQKMK